MPFSRLQKLSVAEATASKNRDGRGKAENELDQKVGKDLEREKAEVKTLGVLFREDIVNAGRPLSPAA